MRQDLLSPRAVVPRIAKIMQLHLLVFDDLSILPFGSSDAFRSLILAILPSQNPNDSSVGQRKLTSHRTPGKDGWEKFAYCAPDEFADISASRAARRWQRKTRRRYPQRVNSVNRLTGAYVASRSGILPFLF